MLQAFEVIRHIRQRVRDIAPVIPYTIPAGESYSPTTPGSLTISPEYGHLFWPGQEVEILPAAPYKIGHIDTFRVLSLQENISGGETVSYTLGYMPGFGNNAPWSGATAGTSVLLVPFNYFSNRTLVSAYNEVVRSLYRRGIYQRVSNMLSSGEEGYTFVDLGNNKVMVAATTPTDTEVLGFYEMLMADAAIWGLEGTDVEYREMKPWREIMPGIVNNQTYTYVQMNNEDYYGEYKTQLMEHGYQELYYATRYFLIDDARWHNDSHIVMEYMAPLNFMPYNVAIHRGRINESYLPSSPSPFIHLHDLPLLPPNLLRLVSLGVEISCYETLLSDRERFDRYSASAWNRAVTPYEIAAPIRMLREEYEREIVAQVQAMPPARRTVWR